MLAAESPDDLRALACELADRGCAGFLLSGGCDLKANVPLGRFASAIVDIKRSTNLMISVHPGLIGEQEASDLVQAGVDIFCIDIVQDPNTIDNILGLNISPQAYENSLASLFRAGAEHIVPHICVGLTGEERAGEIAALEMVARYDITSLALLSFIPTPGTRMATSPIVTDTHFLEIVERAVGTVHCPVMVGCMRPRGNPNLELKCCDAGISGIAVPSGETVRQLERLGIKVDRKEICCAFI
jgi:lipoyl synthase